MASFSSAILRRLQNNVALTTALRQTSRTNSLLFPSLQLQQQQTCVHMMSTYTPSEGSGGSGGRRSLRRPLGYQGGDSSGAAGPGGGSGSGSNNSGENSSASFGLRSNTVTLFPGDFSDHDGNMWDDDGADDGAAYFDDDGSEELSAADLIRRALREKEKEKEARKKKWIENSQPPVRKSIIDARGRSFGKGGRKAAKATVFMQPGLGEIVVNRQDFVDYFVRRSDRDKILAPLVVTETIGAFDLQITVQGGGLTGQAGAARLGIANALNAYNPDLYRPPLKRQGLLERDARIVERKKIGLVKARKAPQWVRR